MRRVFYFIWVSLIMFFVIPGVTAQENTSTPYAKRFPWDNRPNKCFPPGAPALTFGPCAVQPDWPSYQETSYRVAKLFIEPDFDLIDRAESELGFSSEKFPTGEYYFDAWFQALRSIFENNYSGRGEEVLKQWKQHSGEEGYLKLAEALIYYGEAHSARGSGYANTVMPEAWEIYYDKLDKADRVLDLASPKIKKSGSWHVMKLQIAFQSAKLQAKRANVIKAATELWPFYDAIYKVPMNYTHPVWGGSFEVMDNFARYSVEQSRAIYGLGIYPILYESMFRNEGRYTLGDSKVDWPMMKKGFRDLEARKFGQDWLWKSFTKLACQMRDKSEAQYLFEIFDRNFGKRYPATSEGKSTDSCRLFAMSGT